jgi:short-subunit dehydrogenase
MRDLVLITGTSSGIGMATALACADAGFPVIATMRNLERGEQLRATIDERKLDIEIEQLDVTATDARDKVRELVLKYGPIYGLVNNAGIAVGGVFEEQSEQDVLDQFETNVLGVMTVTRSLLSTMRANGRGRIVNVSSVSGLMAFPGLSVYAATKHAIEGFSEGLRLELQQFGIDVCLVEPGAFKTAIWFANQRRAENLDKQGPYGATNGALEKALLGGADKAPGPQVVAARIVQLLTVQQPPFRSVVGREARAIVALRSVVPDTLFSRGMRRILGLPEPPSRSR